jgi:hypothetical protein
VSLAARILFMVAYWRLPLSPRDATKVATGMTGAQVLVALGTPQVRHPGPGGEEVWLYYCDARGARCLGVHFDRAGRVRSCWA